MNAHTQCSRRHDLALRGLSGLSLGSGSVVFTVYHGRPFLRFARGGVVRGSAARGGAGTRRGRLRAAWSLVPGELALTSSRGAEWSARGDTTSAAYSVGLPRASPGHRRRSAARPRSGRLVSHVGGGRRRRRSSGRGRGRGDCRRCRSCARAMHPHQRHSIDLGGGEGQGEQGKGRGGRCCGG